MAPRDPEQLSVEYYLTSLGLKVLDASEGRASLGVGDRELLVLVEEPGAQRIRLTQKRR
jgi:catechol-2,3-dioxygenase